MAVKVVDASAVAALLFGEPEAEVVAERIGEDRLFSPALIEFELANVCWKKCRRDPTRLDAYLAAWGLRLRLPIEEVRVDHAEVLALALDTGLTVYDASYLWLSHHLEAELITLDTALMRAALRRRSARSGLRDCHTADKACLNRRGLRLSGEIERGSLGRHTFTRPRGTHP
jgi:predicted nucleic acid-binding protein